MAAAAKTVALNEGFTQVCVWPACMVVEGGQTPEEFVAFMQKEFGVRVQYLEEIKTNPDKFDDGSPVPGTGQRNDLFFAVHDGDVMKFAIARLQFGIRWIEDVLARGNRSSHLYPTRVRKYKRA